MESSLRDFSDAASHDGSEQVGAADVHIGEVRGVRFVHVEVYFEEGRVGLRDHWLEEGMWRYRRGLEEDLVPVGFEEAELRPDVSLRLTVCTRGRCWRVNIHARRKVDF